MPLVLRLFGQDVAGARRALLLQRTLALFGLALVAVTWRLWTPQQVFPQVPLVALATQAPGWCDWLGAAGMTIGLLLALVVPAASAWGRRGLVLFATSAGAMFLLDQNRLQPWAYQMAIMALVLAWADGRSAVAILRLFVASFYFHSALTKLDYSFLHTLGQQFLATLVGLAGGSLDSWSDPARIAAALAFPLGELLVAVGLCVPRTRVAALFGAVTLHVLLLVILGPWGLDHKPGVLVWNAFFIVQDVLLFGPERWFAWILGSQTSAEEPMRAPWRVQGLVAAVVSLPLLVSTTWFDMWPSWGLYASGSERVMLLVHRSELGNLPKALLSYVEESTDDEEPWSRLRLDRWCLEMLGTPIYPQNRAQLGAAQAVIERYITSHRARVVRFGLADRWTGGRSHEVFTGMAQLQAAGGEYFWNTSPRRTFFEGAARAE
jgi:hypothetical protein